MTEVLPVFYGPAAPTNTNQLVRSGTGIRALGMRSLFRLRHSRPARSNASARQTRERKVEKFCERIQQTYNSTFS